LGFHAVEALPSKGYGTQETGVQMNPMTYREILKYETRNPESDSDRLLWDIECVLNSMSNYKNISLYDLRVLIFIRKFISSSGGQDVLLSYSCPSCGSQEKASLNLSSLKWIPIKDDVRNLEAIILKERRFKFVIPSIGYFEDCLRKILGSDLDYPLRSIYICSLLGFIENPAVKTYVDRAALDEILLLDYIYNLTFNSVSSPKFTCERCEKESVIGIEDSITDIFQSIRTNYSINQEKIITK
jgi:hypothetical protein